MSKKRKNTVIATIIIIILVLFMLYNHSKEALVRQLQGPTEGTDSVFTIDDKLFAVSKSNHIYTWQWNDLSKWPIVARPDAQIITPVAESGIIYIPSTGYNGLILSELKGQKEIARLDIAYGAECKKVRASQNGQYGAASILFNEGAQKDWFKLALFGCDLKGMTFVFQKDTTADDFRVYDFDVTNDGSLLAGAGEKGRGWVFVMDAKNEKIVWEKTFNEYSQFTCVEFSPDGKTLFAAEKVRYILAFDSATGRQLHIYEMPLYQTPSNQKQNISCIAVSPDGKTLAADTEPAGTVWFWDVTSGQKISEIHASSLTVSDIAFSPDSKYLATGCLVSPEIKIWKVPQLKNE